MAKDNNSLEQHFVSQVPQKHAEDSVMGYMPVERSWLRYEPLYQGRGMTLALHKTCLNYFEEAVKNAPDAPALTMNGQMLSFEQVSLSVNAFAAWMLNDTYIKAGDRIALYLPNSLTYLIAVLASFKAKLVVANLNTQLGQQDILRQLQDCGAKVLITIPTYLPQVEDMLLETSIRHIVTTQADDYESFWGRVRSILSTKKWLEKWRADNTVIQYVRLRQILQMRLDKHTVWPVVEPRDLAVIQYTSGTTEQPKAAALTHQNLSANFQQVKHMIGPLMGPGHAALCPVPLQHISGLSLGLGVLSVGGNLVLTTIPDLLHRTRSLQSMKIDIMLGMPYLYDQLLSKAQDWSWFRQINLFLCGGGFSSRRLMQKWSEQTGRQLCEVYGLSEAGPVVCMNPPHRIRPGSVGIVLPNTQVCIVDAEQKPLGFNQPGELWVRGPQVMRGYWHKPLHTQDVLTFDDWLKTGDIVALSEDGFMSMLERKKDAFWAHNQWVLPHQLEQQINQHEDIIDCMLLCDETHSNAFIRLLVIARQGLTADNIQRYLKEQLHSNILLDAIEFVDYLPKGPMGKVLRRVLRSREREDGLAEAHLPEKDLGLDEVDTK